VTQSQFLKRKINIDKIGVSISMVVSTTKTIIASGLCLNYGLEQSHSVHVYKTKCLPTFKGHLSLYPRPPKRTATRWDGRPLWPRRSFQSHVLYQQASSSAFVVWIPLSWTAACLLQRDALFMPVLAASYNVSNVWVEAHAQGAREMVRSAPTVNVAKPV
jgi:hypothetical protein